MFQKYMFSNCCNQCAALPEIHTTKPPHIKVDGFQLSSFLLIFFRYLIYFDTFVFLSRQNKWDKASEFIILLLFSTVSAEVLLQSPAELCTAL